MVDYPGILREIKVKIKTMSMKDVIERVIKRIGKGIVKETIADMIIKEGDIRVIKRSIEKMRK